MGAGHAPIPAQHQHIGKSPSVSHQERLLAERQHWLPKTCHFRCSGSSQLCWLLSASNSLAIFQLELPQVLQPPTHFPAMQAPRQGESKHSRERELKVHTSNLVTAIRIPLARFPSAVGRISRGLRRNFKPHSLVADAQILASFSPGFSRAVLIISSVSRFLGLGTSEN